MTDPAQVELGRKLFMDDRLSQDGTVQCETCHQLDKGGVDRLDVSIGIEGKKVASTRQPYLTPHLTSSSSGMVVQSILLTKQVDHRLTRLKWVATPGMTS